MKKVIFFGVLQVLSLRAAILPPPWADPERNPCASKPGGWLLVYWPPDGKCYRIFQRGHPCPETMELNPTQENSNQITAECRCPPRTAQMTTSNVCYPINSRGPCKKGEFFAPLRLSPPSKQRIGHCLKAKQCKSEEVFWPGTNQCYSKFTKGPCPDGQLLILNKETLLGECQCHSKNGTLDQYYWSPTKTCHQYYTKGPCLEKGTLFLPGPICGCNNILPNYDPKTNLCYEIGTTGPCKPGHKFDIYPPNSRAICTCKPEHVLWEDGQCYRLYTKGPCFAGEIIFADKICGRNPCPKGKLYFPQDGSCHRVGVRGPCSKGQLVLFERSIRPSIEGISYRGVCGFSEPGKYRNGISVNASESLNSEMKKFVDDDLETKSNTKNTRYSHHHSKEIPYKIRVCEKHEKPMADNCHSLYSQGPCSQGEWLIPVRQGRTEKQYIHRFGGSDPDSAMLQDESTKLKARCECKPGYNKSPTTDGCHLPLVSLAKFLNGDDLYQLSD